MNTLKTGPTLHDKTTRGEPLTKREQSILDAWYAAQDEEETTYLEGFDISPGSPAASLAVQRQIDTLLAQIKATTTQIESLIEQNGKLRQENQIFQQQFAQRLVADTV